MTFNPNIPQATDLISVSQGDLLTNFGQANTIFAIDHVTFNDATVADRGFHKKVQFNGNTASGAQAGTQSEIYTFGATPLPAFRNSTGSGYLVPVGARVRFNTAGGQLGTSLNIASVVVVSPQIFRITMTAALSDTNYLVFTEPVVQAGSIAAPSTSVIVTSTTVFDINVSSPTALASISVIVYGQVAAGF